MTRRIVASCSRRWRAESVVGGAPGQQNPPERRPNPPLPIDQAKYPLLNSVLHPCNSFPARKNDIFFLQAQAAHRPSSLISPSPASGPPLRHLGHVSARKWPKTLSWRRWLASSKPSLHPQHRSSCAWDAGTDFASAEEQRSAALTVEAVTSLRQLLHESPQPAIGDLRRFKVRSHISHGLTTLRTKGCRGCCLPIHFPKHFSATEANPMCSGDSRLSPTRESVERGH